MFRDYLPHILGDNAVRTQIGPYSGYNPNVDPSISNVFATAAYRFAHLAIQPFLSRLDANYRENNRFPSVSLYRAFFTPWRIVFEGERYREKTPPFDDCVLKHQPNLNLISPGGVDSLLRGLIGRPAKLNTQDHMMVDALRERLFQFVQHLALDLGSLNMQRGRDHGLPGTSVTLIHLFFLMFFLMFHLCLNCTLCLLVVYSSRLQRLPQGVWPVSAPEPGGARSGSEQQQSGPKAAAALRFARQHRCLDGRCGGTVCPGRPSGTSVCLSHRKTVPEDPPG